MNVADSICRVLGDTLGRDVTGKKTAFPLTSSQPRIVVVFGEDDESIASICVCDISFAALAGAALVLIPPGAAKDAIRSGKCPPDLLENLAEIFSICRQCFQEPGHHIAPPRIYTDPQQVPPPVTAAISPTKPRIDLEITIAGYGTGRLSVFK